MDLPAWLVWLSIAALAVAFGSAAYIVYDILAGRRSMMTVMKFVWPITALYLGPVAIWLYLTLGVAGKSHQKSGRRHGKDGAPPDWRSIVMAVSHCGAGCTLGDIVAEWGIFIMGVTLAGLALWPEYIADYLLAYLLGIIFQYFSIAPMRGLGLKDGIIAAVKADTLSLTAFEVGLFGWMALSSFVFFHHQLHPDSPVFWFMMQLGMVVGFATAYPMNRWLLMQGLKETM